MNMIKLNNWYVIDNSLTLSIKNFHIYIDIRNNNQHNSIQLKIIDKNEEQIIFYFNTLEESISFIENTIINCKNIDDIIGKYKEYYINTEVEKNNKIVLTPNEVDQALFEYFSEGKDYRVSIKEELTIEKDNPKLSYYLIEHIDKDNINSTLLTNGDIKNALDKYVKFYNYELIDFKYKGGIHRVGYYFDNDTPYYEGIELKVKRLDKKLILKK